MSDPKTDEWISANELSGRLGVATQTIYSWVDDKSITQGVHYLVVGKIYKFSWEAIFEWASTAKGDRHERRRRRAAAAAVRESKIWTDQALLR
jgi:hypothetical protein